MLTGDRLDIGLIQDTHMVFDLNAHSGQLLLQLFAGHPDLFCQFKDTHLKKPYCLFS